ncbi:MAG TPA: hypothetical protein EYP65_02725 [Armatimonadetes bacterium]|nr:hypothetical protein [Armatimonadota bacterium]
MFAVITFENGRLLLRFDKWTGALLEVVDKRWGFALAGGFGPQVDIKVDGAWAFSGAKGILAGGRALGLDGVWEFRIEGRRWRKIRVPGAWEDQGVKEVAPGSPNPSWKPYNGIAYFRWKFLVPGEWQGRTLVLYIGTMDDEDWVYINGRLVGHTGMDKPNWWPIERAYKIPSKFVNFGGENEILVKVYDRGEEGGFWGL